MYQNIKKLSYLIIAGVISISSTFIIPVVYAQEPINPGGSGLRVSPTRSELVIEKDASKDVVHIVKNVTQNPVTVKPALNDFESDGVTGQPKLVGDPSDISAHSLRSFLTVPVSFDLQPDEEKEVTITLNVSVDSSPGAYYGSMLYRAAPIGSSETGQVALVASVGSLILLEVPGNITEKIAVKGVSAYIDDKSGSIFTQKPNNIGVLIENLGNSYSKPFGKIQVKDWRGKKIFEYELNGSSRRSNILPNTSRLFMKDFNNIEEKTVNGELKTDKVSPLRWPGKYTISGDVSHSSNGELFFVSASFWYIPTWLIAVSVAFLLVLISLAFVLRRKFKTRATRRRR